MITHMGPETQTGQKFGKNVSNTLEDILLTMYSDAHTDASTDERDKNSMVQATLRQVEA